MYGGYAPAFLEPENAATAAIAKNRNVIGSASAFQASFTRPRCWNSSSEAPDGQLLGAEYGLADQLARVDRAEGEDRAEHRQGGVAPADLARGPADQETDTDGRVADLVLGGADQRAVGTRGDDGDDDRRHQAAGEVVTDRRGRRRRDEARKLLLGCLGLLGLLGRWNGLTHLRIPPR